MVNISKRQLNKNIQEKLLSQFINLFSNTNKQKIAIYFEELFSPTEKIMFIKRLAIIFLLSEQYSPYRISNLLKVSNKTVRDMRFKLDDGQYQNILKSFKHQSFNKEQFLTNLLKVLHAGMPTMTRTKL